MIKKNREMILDAAETVLGIFGFDRRSVYGNPRKKGNKKWWWLEELTEERMQDIRTEMS